MSVWRKEYFSQKCRVEFSCKQFSCVLHQMCIIHFLLHKTFDIFSTVYIYVFSFTHMSPYTCMIQAQQPVIPIKKNLYSTTSGHQIHSFHFKQSLWGHSQDPDPKFCVVIFAVCWRALSNVTSPFKSSVTSRDFSPHLREQPKRLCGRDKASCVAPINICISQKKTGLCWQNDALSKHQVCMSKTNLYTLLKPPRTEEKLLPCSFYCWNIMIHSLWYCFVLYHLAFFCCRLHWNLTWRVEQKEQDNNGQEKQLVLVGMFSTDVAGQTESWW